MKSLILLLLLTAPLAVFAQFTYNIKGSISNASPNTKVFLTYYPDGKKTTDSTIVVNGHFQFTGKLVDTINADFVFKNGVVEKMGVPAIYLVAGTTFINGSMDSLFKASVTGNKYNEDMMEYQKFMAPVNDQFGANNRHFFNATPEQKQSKTFQEAYHKKDDSLEFVANQLTGSYIAGHPDSYMSMIWLRRLSKYEHDNSKLAADFNKLSLRLRTTKLGVDYWKYISALKTTRIGELAPDFAEADTNGNMVKLSSFRGKYVLLDFWASWCMPCREENPNVVKAYEKFKGKNFTVISLSLDQPGKKDSWLNAIHNDHLTWTQLSGLKYWDDAVVKLYGIHSVPDNFLIDPSGKIIAKDLRGTDLDNKLTQIFGNM